VVVGECGSRLLAMPVYEEKLISPLALRFTQEHIKTIFRDGHVVEETVGEIEVQPSTHADYDLVLTAPFPQIEIIRWGRGDGDGQGLHWFTLDNRRLYCLQKAAMKHWPQRVAAKVEILYADPGAVKRKYDSTTLGESVTVADSCKDAPLFRWDWRVDAPCLREAEREAARRARELVSRDDARREVDELSDVTETTADSILARALRFEQALADGSVARCPTPSTAASDGSEDTPRYPQRKLPNRRAPPPRDDTSAEAVLQALKEISQQLQAPRSDGRLRIRNWNERFGGQLGSLRKFIEARPERYVLIPEKEGKFIVQEVQSANAVEEDVGTADGPSEVVDSAVAKHVIAHIRQQLEVQGGTGHVQIKDWNGQYAASLGPFKAFIRSCAKEFVVVPSNAKHFKLTLV